MRSKIKNLQNYFDNSFLKKTIDELEEIAIASASSSSHPYYIAHRDETDKYALANLLSIVEDKIVLPLVCSSFDSKVTNHSGKYHLSHGWGTHVFLRKHKHKIVDNFVPDQAIAGIRADISKTLNDNVDKISDSRLLFRSRNSSGEFLGLNIDSLVWNSVGFNFYEELVKRLSQKYSHMPKSKYFPELNSKLSRLGDYGPAVYHGNNDKNISMFGRHLKKSKPIPLKYKKERIEFDIEKFNGLSPLLEEKKEYLLSLIHKEISSGFSTFDLGNTVREIIPYKFKDELVKWSLGTYFDGEGVFNNTYSHHILKEVSPQDNSPEVSEMYKQQLGESLVKFAKHTLDIISPQSNELKVCGDYIGRYDSCSAVYARFHSEIIRGPKIYSSITNLANFLKNTISGELRTGLGFNVKSSQKNSLKNVPYYAYSDKSEIGWDR